MRIKEARKTVKQLRKAGILGTIKHDRAACLLHNPRMHTMGGDYIVVESGTAKNFSAPRVWTNLIHIQL